MLVSNNKNCDFEERIFIKKKDDVKIIHNNTTVPINSKVQIPKFFLLANEDEKKERTTYVLNKKQYNISHMLNKSSCYINNKDNATNNKILSFLKMSSNYIKSSFYVHKKILNKIIIKNNKTIVKYHVPYIGDIFKSNIKRPNVEIKVKDFIIGAQKYSYIEYYMGFEGNEIENVEGLPQGMVFNKNCLKGTPVVSGDFIIKIKFDNKKIVSGILKIPQIPRQL